MSQSARRSTGVESPCIKICTLDPAGEVCVGCRRTLDEIGRWAQMSQAERQRILDEIPARPHPDP